MRGKRMSKMFRFLATGAILLQFAGCNFNFTAANEALQTVLLGVTAAGAVAIIENI